MNFSLCFQEIKTAWVLLFERLGGKVAHMEHLGIDHPIVPEWHTLYVVEK